MKNKILMIFAVALFALGVSTAQATHYGDNGGGYNNGGDFDVCKYFPRKCNGGRNGGGNKIPELDGAAAPIALALVSGILGLGVERRRRKNKK